MFKELIVALICVVTFNSAARVPHGEPIKKQVAYSGYNNIPAAAAFYQDPTSQFYSTAAAYPQSQAGVVGQGQTVSNSAAGTAGVSVKQSYVPQKVGSTQFSYPFKQYYPQIYPQNSQYPSVPSVFYVPSQGRYPSAANEGAVGQEGSGVSSGSQGGSPGGWFSGWNQVPSNWQSPQFPQLPQGGGNYPSFPSVPNYPANLPQFPSQFPSQLPSQFPQFPSNFPTGNFPTGNFPTGNFPSFAGNSPANAVPTGASPTVVPGSESVAGATTNSEGHSVVVVSARRPEKIENVDSNAEGVKNENSDKAAVDFPQQQYYVFQPQYVLPNGGQVPVVQTAGGKDPAQLDGAAKGAISSFLYQQQQPIVAQPATGQQYSQISQNKLYSPQEFQELLQQVQAANKKLIESTGGGAVPQFYYQQGVPQQGFVQQQGVNSQGQSQDVSLQQAQGVIPQQYVIQGAQPVQPYLQFAAPNRQIFVPQFASLPQQKPIVGDVSNVPGVQGVDGTVPVTGAGPTPVSIPSVSSSLSANDSTSSPEPNNNADSESTGSSADTDIKNEVNEIPFNDVVNVYQSTTPTEVDSSSGSTIQVTKPDAQEANDYESTSTTENTNEQNNLEFGARLNIVKPKAQKL